VHEEHVTLPDEEYYPAEQATGVFDTAKHEYPRALSHLMCT